MPPTRQEQFDALTIAISRVLTPVMLCMALSVWFVHSLGDPEKCRPLSKSRQLPSIGLTPDTSVGESTSVGQTYSALLAGIFIGIFVVMLVAFTFLLVWLYKTGRTKVIVGWLLVAVFLIFAYVGGLYMFDFCRSRCINLDWITLTIAVWNFTVTGLFAIFGVVPRFINQIYLIVMSSLMAYIFRSLPSWSIWVILGALVLWDLFAVLSPHGPLKKLVEAARERGDPLPALVYDTNPHDVGRDVSAQPAVIFPTKSKRSRKKTSDPEQASADTVPAEPSDTETAGATIPAESTVPQDPPQRSRRSRRKKKTITSAENDTPEGTVTDTAATPAPMPRAQTENGSEEVGVGTLGAHLKLGLGDFVFYSILVAQASQDGAMTTIASFVAILAGLCVTLFLVTVYKKALPALPISITLGLIFYFLTRYTVQPFVANLMTELLFY